MMKRVFALGLLAAILASGVAKAAPASAAAPAASAAPEAASAVSARAASEAASAPALGAPSTSPAIYVPPAAPGSAVPATSLFQTIFGLLLVLGTLVGLAWLLKRFGPRQLQDPKLVRLVGGLSLGGRERVMVVEVGETWIVVGAAPGRVNALATMPKQATADVSAPADGRPANNFGDWLKQTLDKKRDAQD